ncbi:hypothetical protein [Streptomyces sp. CB02460]|uniref:hypothetical protein n=1 Tax=Streptomyces sp. CB02460 TaxID=1703941 RepID=UPI003082D753
MVAVGGGGLFAGVATPAQHHGVRTVAVEPENCRALTAARAVGHVVDVTVDSVAADSLGARRTAGQRAVGAGTGRWHRACPEGAVGPPAPGGRTRGGDSARGSPRRGPSRTGDRPPSDCRARGDPRGSYRAEPGQKVCVVLCGANTDPSDLV